MRIKNKYILIAGVLAVFLLSSFYIEVVRGATLDYEPLAHIPGIPSGNIGSLSVYLIGLYNFALSVVGIAAVLMLIIGGMKYIISIGSSSATSEAKDMIYNAILGLLLALLTWVIVSTINPDILHIKRPGSGFETKISVVNLGDCGEYISSSGNCECKGPASSPYITTATSQEQCNEICRDPPERCLLSVEKCMKAGTLNIGQVGFSDPEKNDGKCICVDGERITPLSSDKSCQDTCEDQHCLVADLRVKGFSIEDHDNIPGSKRKYATEKGSETIPYLVSGYRSFLIEGEYYSTFFHTVLFANYKWDDDRDGLYDDATGYFYEIGDATTLYDYSAALAAFPNLCKKEAKLNDALVCKLGLKITDSTGNESVDAIYFGWYNPSKPLP